MSRNTDENSSGRGHGASAQEEPRDWLVWSNTYNSWWGPNSAGYRDNILSAGRYTRAQAELACGSRSKTGDRAPEVAVQIPDLAVFTAAAAAVKDITRRITEANQTGKSISEAA